MSGHTDDNASLKRQFGPYQCTHLLGMSSNNAVYAAVHQDTQQQVALRVMTIVRRDADAALADCQRELNTVLALDNPHIITVDDFGTDGMTLYLATRILRGGSLADRLKQHHITGSSLPSSGEIINMIETMADALDYIHREGMIHGQVEPRNIMFDGSGKAYLTDIGVARLLKIIYGLDASNSFTTSKYSAPELWDGQRPQPASDQYSLACVAYELFTGRPPFEGPTIFELMKQHRNNVALPPHYVRETLSGDLAIPFWKALAKPPQNRYADAAAFVNDLRDVVAGDDSPSVGFFTSQIT